MQHMVNTIFVQAANTTLLCWDCYLEYLKPGVQPDTWCFLRNSYLHHSALFHETVIAKAKDDTTKSEADAREKQVPLGRLTMRPKQWHLKTNWHVPDSLEKRIPVPRLLHKHLGWWLQEDNVLVYQPLHSLQYMQQIFTDTSNVGWGAHVGDFTARGLWSVPESKLYINFLELKVVLALKSFEHLCRNQTVLIATDNTTVVT